MDLAPSYREHRRSLWGLAYRMLGTRADADEVVQDAFVKALEAGPDPRDSLGPWLWKVTLNLSRDRLRRRRRRPYHGSWLPSPVPADALSPASPEARISQQESASLAFLLALETLSPSQRAVLLLSEVFDHSARESAELLGMTEGNVRVTLHRARRILAAAPPGPDNRNQTELTIAFFSALSARDYAAAAALLADDVRMVSDANGEFQAHARELVGRGPVIGFLRWLVERSQPGDRYRIVESNGLATVQVERSDPPPRISPRSLTQLWAREGRICALVTVLASAKLTGGPADPSGPPFDR